MEIKPIFKGENVLPIVFAFNDEYSKYFAVALQSLIENSSKNYKYDIVIFTSSIRQRNQDLLEKMLPNNFKIRFFNVADFIRNIFNQEVKSSNYWSVEMYYRMIIPIVMKNYEKVLYLDSDIICNNDVKELFEIDFNEKQILAVSDTFNIVSEINEGPERDLFNRKILKLNKNHCYFNSGVLLFNNKNIDSEFFIKLAKEALKIKEPYCPDQDILNSIFKDTTICIDNSWNLQYHIPIFHKKDINLVNKTEYEKYCKAFNNPKIIHYTSPVKPWHSPKEELAEYFWRYARKTEFYEEILYSMQQNEIINSRFANNLYIKLQQEKKVFLWGASIFLEKFIKQYDIKTKNILGIIDKNIHRQNSCLGSYKIFSPEELKKTIVDEVIVTIINSSEKRFEEIETYLKENNLSNIKLTKL